LKQAVNKAKKLAVFSFSLQQAAKAMIHGKFHGVA